MAKLILKIEVKDGVRPSLVFASKSDTIGASGEFYAPTGWTASIQDGLVYLKKNTPETSTGFKNYTLDNFGWNYEKIAFPKQVVTRLSDEELFLNQSSKHTLSANSGVLTFKFKDDFVGLTSNDNIKLVKHMAYTLVGN